MEDHCASETALFLGARPRFDVPAAASNKQLSCACAQEKNATARALSLGSKPRPPTSSFLAHVRKKKRHRARSLSRQEAQHAHLRRVRAAPRWLESIHALWKPTVPVRRPSPSEHSRAPMCQPRPPTSRRRSSVRTCKRATVRSLSGEGAPRALAACARRAALVGVGSCPMDIHCASATAHSLDARPCSDVPAAASNEQPALHVRTRERATARFLSRKEVHHVYSRRV